MILKRIHVKNFRSIREATVELQSQTAILGGNGTGKSTILRAMDRFYGPSTNIELDDFFGRQTLEPIEIALTFTEFNDVEQALFESRIHGGEMTVVRLFEAAAGRNNGRYFGSMLQHAEFNPIRTANGAQAQRTAYNQLRQAEGIYADLPAVQRGDQIPTALSNWEAQHVNQCELGRDDGQFFGFTNVARGALQKATSFVFIPAVRDASADSVDARGAVIAKLMELVVRSAIQQRADVRQWQTRIATEYKELTDPEKLQELGGLSNELTTTLQLFYREASVALQWKPAEDFSIPLPTTDVLLDDDGFQGPVDRKGHGLQRAFILTLLQHLAIASALDDAKRERAEEAPAVQPQNGEALARPQGERMPPQTLPGLILAIEEPELYQHPTKQRHFAKVLSQLSDGRLPGVAARMQIIFASHSSLFVSMDRFDEVRVAYRHPVPDTVFKECKLAQSALSKVARLLEHAFEVAPGAYTAEGLRARLHIIDAEIAEGLFADAVVLVEGASDKAAVVASAALNGIDLESMGIAVLAVDGKTKLDKPTAILLSLDIPTFVIWDCDNNGGQIEHVNQNRALQRLLGVTPAEVVDSRSHIAPTFACFERTLETTLKHEIGIAVFDQQLDEVRQRYGIEGRADAQKAPFAMRDVLVQAAAQGCRSASLDQIVQAIVTLRQQRIMR